MSGYLLQENLQKIPVQHLFLRVHSAKKHKKKKSDLKKNVGKRYLGSDLMYKKKKRISIV